MAAREREEGGNRWRKLEDEKKREGKRVEKRRQEEGEEKRGGKKGEEKRGTFS